MARPLRSVQAGDEVGGSEEGRVSEHIGPVRFNMGGIQVDADDMLQRLKVYIHFIHTQLWIILSSLPLTFSRTVRHIRLLNQHPQALHLETVNRLKMKHWHRSLLAL